MDKSLVIFLHSSRYDRLYQAVNLLLTASSMDWKCHLFLFFDALASFMEGTWDDVNVADMTREEISVGEVPSLPPPWIDGLHKNLELANFPSLYQLIEKARKQEIPAAVYACSTSVRLLNLDSHEVKAHVGDIVGLPTMLQIAAEAKHTIYI
jgi:peroxiredoxin family protein